MERGFYWKQYKTKQKSEAKLNIKMTFLTSWLFECFLYIWHTLWFNIYSLLRNSMILYKWTVNYFFREKSYWHGWFIVNHCSQFMQWDTFLDTSKSSGNPIKMTRVSFPNKNWRISKENLWLENKLKMGNI